MKKKQNKGGRPAMSSGKRTHIIKAKLTDEEIGVLRRIQQESGLNRTELIRKRVLGGTVVIINIREIISLFDPIGAELGRAGNNINQLARHANMLNKQHKLDPSIVTTFNALLTKYIQIQGELEKALRQLLRKIKDT
ncbi:plasmid mobilization protein [Sphingobacterium hungaricum]|uniref:Plasmid mobilization relaxosome protein MobC n=1 Tax=Sphingobacterium hungaricum TaxID=2082723 RepID=A0A928V0G6_9SPHI|nr:plasmid mobilization relaxosome protein MobC [Sphingobacterium hungaricum]MBE8714830.1 plasmid mobilization relaxosome protein MobC [Sphingobacterium hungaricum]